MWQQFRFWTFQMLSNKAKLLYTIPARSPWYCTDHIQGAGENSVNGEILNSSPIRVVTAGKKISGWGNLVRYLSEDPSFKLIGCSEIPGAIVSFCQQVLPCVLLTDDTTISGIDQSDFGNRIDFGRLIQVLVVVEDDSAEFTESMLRMGCMGTIRRGSSAFMVRRAVRAVAVGEFWTSRKTLSVMLRERLQAENPCQLTSREGEVLHLIEQGLTNQEIADRLCISRETVRWHLRSLHAKIGALDRRTVSNHASRTEAGAPRKPSTVAAQDEAGVLRKTRRMLA
jgi:DNA-binding NarL/FixJ family response regulator